MDRQRNNFGAFDDLRYALRTRKSLVLLVALGMTLALGIAPAAAAPADGSGNKDIIELEFTVPGLVDCGGGDLLDFGIDGWVQFSEFSGNGNKNIDRATVHLELTYTNADGGTFSYLEVGVDKVSMDGDGNLVLAGTGRLSDTYGTGASLNGRAVVINFDFGSVSVTGNQGPSAADQACAALT
jgi:hypothetical protein